MKKPMKKPEPITLQPVADLLIYGWYGPADLAGSVYEHNAPFAGTEERGWEIARESVNQHQAQISVRRHGSFMTIFVSRRNGFGQR